MLKISFDAENVVKDFSKNFFINKNLVSLKEIYLGFKIKIKDEKLELY